MYVNIFQGNVYESYQLLKPLFPQQNLFDSLKKENMYTEKIKVIEYLSTFSNLNKWLQWENVSKKWKNILKKIQKHLSKDYCIGGGTSLVLLWKINRYSEDIDIFCSYNKLEDLRQKISKILNCKMRSIKSNHGYGCHLYDDLKIEIIPIKSTIKTIEKENIKFMNPRQTLDNKFKAIQEREETRDIYDLAVFSFIEYNYFFSRLNDKHVQRIWRAINNGVENEKLLRVLKNKKYDKLILHYFFNKLIKDYNLKWHLQA